MWRTRRRHRPADHVAHQPAVDPRCDPVPRYEGRVLALLPLELIRKDPDRVRRAAELKGEPAPIDEILKLDAEWRRHLFEAETIKAEQNRLSKQLAQRRDPELK